MHEPKALHLPNPSRSIHGPRSLYCPIHLGASMEEDCYIVWTITEQIWTKIASFSSNLYAISNNTGVIIHQLWNPRYSNLTPISAVFSLWAWSNLGIQFWTIIWYNFPPILDHYSCASWVIPKPSWQHFLFVFLLSICWLFRSTVCVYNEINKVGV